MIGNVVEQIRATELANDYQILVIDDGSTDHSAQEARSAGARVISLVRNLGYGYALRTGYQVAYDEGFDLVVQMDGDGQHSAESIPALMTPVMTGQCDVVIGSRSLSDVHYPMPWARRQGQRFFSWILHKMSGVRLYDATSGYQVLGRKALALFARGDFPGDYPDTDVLLYLSLHGLKIEEVPAVFRANEKGTSMHNGVLRPAYYIYKMLFSMLVVYLRFKREEREGMKR